MAGVRGVVVISSGFAEVHGSGRTAQEELRLLVRSHGMRMVGPNCMGLINVRRRLLGTFTPSAAGARSAAIHIASNDANESPFDITLTGTATAGLSVIESWRQTWFGITTKHDVKWRWF